MANQQAESEKKSSMGPILIIGLIAVATVLGIYVVSQNSGDETETSNSNQTASNTSNDAARTAYRNAPPGATPANFRGSQNALVVVEEFADFQCPTCMRVHPKVKEAIAPFGNRIKFVFRNFPLTQIHQNAYEAAVSAEAAGFQGKFWQMQEMIFAGQPTWSGQTPNARATFKEYAQRIGLNVEQWENDLLGVRAKTRVDADMQRGRALNVQSTPTILINGKAIPFSQMETEQIKQLITAELERVEGKTDDDGSDEENKDGSEEKADSGKSSE